MPEYPKPDPDFTQEQALTMILSSIALEEVALSHIINAEGEKIQYILKQTNCGPYQAHLKDILAVNRSVTSLLEMVLQNQMILKSKMEKVLEYLPRPSEPPAPPNGQCRPPQPAISLDVTPKYYRCNEPLEWQRKPSCGNCPPEQGESSKILIPGTGSFLIALCLDVLAEKKGNHNMTLALTCRDKPPILHDLCFNDGPSVSGLRTGMTIQVPRGCGSCHAFLLVRDPCGMHIRGGNITLTRR